MCFGRYINLKFYIEERNTMSDLRFEPFTMKGHKVGKASWFPAVRELIKSEFAAELDEDDGLFICFND